MQFKQKEKVRENKKKYKTEKERVEAHKKQRIKWQKNNPDKVKAAYNKFRRSKKGKLYFSKKYSENWQKIKNNPKLYAEYKKKHSVYKKNQYLLRTEKFKKRLKLYLEKNKERIKGYQRAFYHKHKYDSKYSEYRLKYEKTGKAKKARQRYKRSDKFKENYKKNMKDPKFKIAKNLRSRLRHSIKYHLIPKKKINTLDLLGCDLDSFKRFIERKFKKGMSWENWGPKSWHIDHIKPVAKFDLIKISDQKKCFHYSNLQPLWAKDNLKKSAKLL